MNDIYNDLVEDIYNDIYTMIYTMIYIQWAGSVFERECGESKVNGR